MCNKGTCVTSLGVMLSPSFFQRMQQQGTNMNMDLLNNQTALTALLSYHFLQGRHTLSDLRKGEQLTTQLGSRAGAVTVEQASPSGATFRGASNTADAKANGQFKTCRGCAPRSAAARQTEVVTPPPT